MGVMSMIGWSSAPQRTSHVADFWHVAPFWNQSTSKVTGRKSKPNFTLLTPVKLGDECAKCQSWFYELGLGKPLIHFWWHCPTVCEILSLGDKKYSDRTCDFATIILTSILMKHVRSIHITQTWQIEVPSSTFTHFFSRTCRPLNSENM